LEPTDDTELYLLAILKLQKNVSWSNKKYVNDNFPLIWNYNLELLKSAEDDKRKSTRNTLYAFSAMLKINAADSIVRFENYSASKDAIDDANLFIGKLIHLLKMA